MEERLDHPAPLPVVVSVRLVVGLFLTLLGILLTLDNLNLIEGGRYLRYWPIVFIAVGIVQIVNATSRGLGMFWVAAGAVLLGLNARWIRFSLFDLWPLVLIGAGGVIVAQGLGYRPQLAVRLPPGTILAVLSQRKITVDSRNFTGTRIVAVLGACNLDITAADIEHSPAIIEVFALMGGVEMRVPDGWEVIGDAVPFMGGIDIKTRSKRTGRQLILRGFVMMGGVDVKDVAARTATA